MHLNPNKEAGFLLAFGRGSDFSNNAKPKPPSAPTVVDRYGRMALVTMPSDKSLAALKATYLELEWTADGSNWIPVEGYGPLIPGQTVPVLLPAYTDGQIVQFGAVAVKDPGGFGTPYAPAGIADAPIVFFFNSSTLEIQTPVHPVNTTKFNLEMMADGLSWLPVITNVAPSSLFYVTGLDRFLNYRFRMMSYNHPLAPIPGLATAFSYNPFNINVPHKPNDPVILDVSPTTVTVKISTAPNTGTDYFEIRWQTYGTDPTDYRNGDPDLGHLRSNSTALTAGQIVVCSMDVLPGRHYRFYVAAAGYQTLHPVLDDPMHQNYAVVFRLSNYVYVDTPS